MQVRFSKWLKKKIYEGRHEQSQNLKIFLTGNNDDYNDYYKEKFFFSVLKIACSQPELRYVATGRWNSPIFWLAPGNFSYSSTENVEGQMKNTL